MKKTKNILQQFDYGLLFLILLLSIISLISVYSATHHYPTGGMHYVIRQAMWYGLGFGVLLATLFIDYRRLKTLSVPLYILGIILLIWVEVAGVVRSGAQRWIGFGEFLLQPSELTKIFLVIIIAHLLAKVQAESEQEKRLFKQDLWLTTKIGALSIVPFALVLSQPDLGTALVLIAIVGIMLLVAGISWRVLFLLIFLGMGLVAGLITLYFVNMDLFSKIIEEHQIERIYGWLDPEGNAGGFGYQLMQALLAIGSGQLLGQGFTEGAQTQGRYIPESHTDFIFAIIGEEFGFIGASILISIYFILIYRLVQIALSCNDPFGSYLIAGVIGMLVFQIYQNIGMAIGLMPITGLALPFISYGGSALLTNMLAMGIVLNVHLRTKVYMFD